MPGKKPTTRAKAAARPICRFYLADDIRQEVGGKISAVGLYGDCVVIAQHPIGLPEPSKDHPVAFGSLAYVVSIAGLAGNHTISLDVFDPSMTFSESPPRVVHFDEGKSTNLITVMRPYVTATYGVKNVELKIDGETFPFSFEVRKGPPPSEEVTVIRSSIAVQADKEKKKSTRKRAASERGRVTAKSGGRGRGASAAK